MYTFYIYYNIYIYVYYNIYSNSSKNVYIYSLLDEKELIDRQVREQLQNVGIISIELKQKRDILEGQLGDIGVQLHKQLINQNHTQISQSSLNTNVVIPVLILTL